MTVRGRYSVLVVEDDPASQRLYDAYMTGQQFDAVFVGTGGEALAVIQSNEQPDIVILDLKLPDMQGQEVLKFLKENVPSVAVIVVTGQSSISVAVEAMRMGASDFLVKPFEPDRFRYTLKNVLERQHLTRMVKTYEETFERREYEGFVGSSLSMQAVYKIIDAAAASDASVFITGETGTGKEVCAKALHDKSGRCEGRYVPLNCAAIPGDLMESEIFGHVKGAFTGAFSDRDGAATLADGGTMFLDDICELHQDLQAKLLRFIHTGTFQRVGSADLEKVSVRFMCATNKDPWKEVESGNFREDLYFRLHVVPVHLPPLRDRGSDIVQIAEFFLREYSREEGKNFSGFTADAEDLLMDYDWPGNVRELQNGLRFAVVLNDEEVISAEMLSHLRRVNVVSVVEGAEVVSGTFGPLNDNEVDHGHGTTVLERRKIVSLAIVEQNHIERALKASDGNVTRAAALLEIGASTLYRKLKDVGHPLAS